MSGAGQDASVRIFISYSNKDVDLVERLKTGLTRAGADVWLDHERLEPGTPSWQIAVRNGITQATHVIYVASETAALSTYVFDEINIAKNKGKPVIPFWARGADWHDCVPIGWGATQYTDGRGASFDAGLARLVKTLGLTTTGVQPSPVIQPTPAAPPPPRYPLPEVPARLANLGFRGVNPNGAPAIIPPLITIPAGPFLMGSDKARDSQARDNELPQHRVEVAAFHIAIYPVTVAEYALAVAAKAVREPPKGAFNEITWAIQRQRQEHPVVNVSWQDAMAYIAWLNKTTGQRGWRLPTEAEWEKAARWDPQRGVSRIYPWGDSFDKNRCNTRESGLKTTSPVGSYPATNAHRSGASPFGVEEMAGNISEWTSSLYKPYPYSQNDGREAPQKTPIEIRTLRGGSWDATAKVARAAFRDDFGLDALIGYRGFRLAASPLSAGSS